MPGRRSKMDSSEIPREMTEAHPNPHGAQEVAETPVETDHGNVTHENPGQNISTRENRLNPSVSGPLKDPTTDSMFNLADRQTREINEESTGEDNLRRKPNKRKASKLRKSA